MLVITENVDSDNDSVELIKNLSEKHFKHKSMVKGDNYNDFCVEVNCFQEISDVSIWR